MKSKANFLDNIPVKNGDILWKERDGLVTLKIEHKGFYNKVAQTVFKTPRYSEIALEEFGSFVWLSIDGEKSIYDIGILVKENFGKAAEPVFERLSKYFYTLKDEKYISFLKRRK